MACNLTTQDVKALYQDLYETILSKVNGTDPKKFNINNYIKALYKDIYNEEDPNNALQVIQAVPHVLGALKANNRKVKEYFVKNKISGDEIDSLDIKFDDLAEVKKYVSTARKTATEVKKEIKTAHKSSKDVKIENPTDDTLRQSVHGLSKAQIEDPLSTTAQFALPKDPTKDTQSDEADPDKVLFYNVIKELIYLTKMLPQDSDQIIYQDKALALKVVPIISLPKQFIAQGDQAFVNENPSTDLLVAVISDTEGNFMYFDKDGNLVSEEEGRPVYQEMRNPVVHNGKLTLVNRSGYEYQMVPAEKIVERENEQYKETYQDRLGMSNSQIAARVKEINDERKENLNALHSLVNTVRKNPEDTYLLPITGGSFGIVKTSFLPMAETDIKVEELSKPIIAGAKRGYVKILVTKPGSTGPIQTPVFLQRGDMTEELAEKIATVLTTTATLRTGDPLTPNLRKTYAEIILGQNIPKNNFTVDVVETNGVAELEVTINGEKISQEDLYTEETKDLIATHLMQAVKVGETTYPANVNYTADYIGGNFTDYTLFGGKVIATEVDYFTFIKPFIKIEYSPESAQFFAGRNAYMQFAIPTKILPANQKNYDLNAVRPVKEPIAKKPRTVKTNTKATSIEAGEVVFEPKRQDSYNLIINNSEQADATLNIAIDFNKGDAKTAKTKSPKYIPVALSGKTKNKSLNIQKVAADNIAEKLNDLDVEVLNVTGNNQVELAFKGYSQREIDMFVKNILTDVLNRLDKPILEIVTTGETGVSEAIIKAGRDLGIAVRVTVPASHAMTVTWKDAKTKKLKSFVVKDKKRFMARFDESKQEAYDEEGNPIKTRAKRKTASKTKEENKKVDKKVNSKSTTPRVSKKQVDKQVKEEKLDTEAENLLREKLKALTMVDQLSNRKTIFKEDLERSKDEYHQSFFDRLFYGRKAQKDKVMTWWNNNPLSKHIPLETLTEIVNSNAFATWNQHGITLFEADGGLAIDLYHEAWHGFTQLFLTMQQKTALYDAVRENAKWAGKEYYDIEEDLAEDFRNYMKFKQAFPGVIGQIFEAIAKVLRAMYGKITRQDMSRPRDIASVKEMFDKLYTGEILDLKPAMENMMFTKLNRTKTVSLIKSESKNFEEFTIDESDQLVNSIDNLIALSIERYNTQFNTSTGSSKILTNPQRRFDLYSQVLEDLEFAKNELVDKLEVIVQSNISTSTDNVEDLQLEQDLSDKLGLLIKAIENFGNIKLALEGKQKSGVVAFHIEKSRFNVIRDAYLDDEDTTSLEESSYFRDNRNNGFSAKDLATEDTMMLLSSVFRVEKSKDGTVTRTTDYFGFPQLEDVDLVWNKAAKVLAGSFDPADMYQRLVQNADNYPEFYQIISMLPNPAVLGPAAYNNVTEVKVQTKFWRDLKKPRVPYVQLNVTKTIEERAQRDEDTGRITSPEKSSFETGVAKANFSIRTIMRDWNTNFVVATPATNPYVDIDELGNPVLNTGKIISRFSNRSGLFRDELAGEFLEALGIVMDRTSPEINLMLENYVKFSNAFGLPMMFESIKIVNAASKTTDLGKIGAAQSFAKNPLDYLYSGLPKELRPKDGETYDVSSKIKALAELQNAFSDGYSNFSVLTPEGNRVWEQFLDNTVTRMVTAINYAKNWQELTRDQADPNGRFKHMRWLAEENNAQSPYSILLNSIFYLDPMLPNYGEKRKVIENGKEVDAKLHLNNIGGTQLVLKGSSQSEGVSTASADATTKFLQEMHTMLMSGIEEFMRHASKNTAMGMRTDDVKTYPGKRTKYLYVDIDSFKSQMSGEGERHAFNIISGYMGGEARRIFRFIKNKEQFSKFTGYNRMVFRKDGKPVMAGEAFTAFDDVLTVGTQKKIYALIDKAISEGQEDFNLVEIMIENQELREEVKADTINYFDKQTAQNLERLESARYVDDTLVDKSFQRGANREQNDEVLVKAYTYNSWIHKFETIILAYGDIVQYNHDKEEFHKRNAGLASGGNSFRSDLQIQSYINGPMFRRYYSERMGYKTRAYDGTMKTAILKEKVVEKSVYYDEYLEELTKSYTKRMGDPKKAAALAEKTLGEYFGMKEADGQGYITFESYRMFKELEGNWSDAQEALYRKIAQGEPVNYEDVVEYFPPYKVQYFGPIQTEGLPLTSFHKFSLAPLIPSVTGTSNINKLHHQMMEQQLDYALFESGSKVGHIGSGDEILNKDGSFNTGVKFTVNTVFAEYLKNQTEVNSHFKGKSIFSTQMRKIILEGLYEKGVIDTTEEDQITNPIVQRYLKNVSEYTDLVREELLEEIGFKEENGKYVPRDKNSLEKLANLIRTNLEREDVFGDHLIDIIDVNEDGTLTYDLSLHPEAAKIEKLLMSIINKRIIKQKVKGEPLVQVSAALYENLFTPPAQKPEQKTEEWAKKYVGSNFLPTYHRGKDGKTAAMKVMIALQGDFVNLLNLTYKGEVIGTIDRLNEAIKDNEWVAENKKGITLVGVRIPVQGLNSMEFMEVYHFLPAEAGNVIIPPTEIVAKSGGDFDIDKLTLYMPNINADGTMPARLFESIEEFRENLDEMRGNDQDVKFMFELQKAALQNELIEDIRNILELSQNFVSLTTPNGTFLLKDIADDLAKYVMDYDPFQNMSGMDSNKSYNAKPEKQKKVISPTRVLEALYNVYKHESNVVGKRTLGLGAVENTFNVLFNSIPGGVTMPASFFYGSEKVERDSLLWLRHNSVVKDGKKLISLSNRYDVDMVNKIADIYSQAMNGWVDVEKDAWIFFIQGNYEVAPTLLYLIKTGVPVDEAIYFVSNPLVREYVKEQRLAKSTFAEQLGRKPKMNVKYDASSRVIAKFFKADELKRNAKGRDRYEVGKAMAEEYLAERKDKTFTKDEMYKLIVDFKEKDQLTDKQEDLAKAMFLHYLQIEQQTSGLTKLKMASNPDTNTKSSGSEVEQSQANIESLRYESKVMEGLIDLMMNDSVIGSFFNNPLALSLNETLFPLRFDKAISDYMIVMRDTMRSESKLHFNDNIELMVNTFRNDIVSYIYQNALRKFEAGDHYKSYDMTTKIPVSMVDLLQFGAYVKENKDGSKTLYLDEKQLKKDFTDTAWIKNPETKDSYQARGLYPVKVGNFRSNKNTDYIAYKKFVAEREYLRSINSLSEYSKTKQFEDEQKIVAAEFPNLKDEKLARMTYEKFLAMKALENTMNPYYLFKDPHYAYGVQLSKYLKDSDLVKKYAVLQKLKTEPNKDNNFFSIFLAEKTITSDLSNLYYKNLKDLANPAVKKSLDPEENAAISDFFSRLTTFAFLQSGLNKTKYSFTNIVDFGQFIFLMQNEVQQFRNMLNSPAKANAFLDKFYMTFLNQHDTKKNPNKARFKDYLMGDMEAPSAGLLSGAGPTVEPTYKENVFTYDDRKGNSNYYRELAQNNPDVFFVYGTTIATLQGKKGAEAQEVIKTYSGDMSLGLPISMNTFADSFISLTPDKYDLIKSNWEANIKVLKELIEEGVPVALSSKGYGNPRVMPQELFVYLSKRLYEEFNYINPGSLIFDDVVSTVQRIQGISDEEILDKHGLEEDPFKCS